MHLGVAAAAGELMRGGDGLLRPDREPVEVHRYRFLVAGCCAGR